MLFRNPLVPLLAAILLVPWGAAAAQTEDVGDAASGKAPASARKSAFQAAVSTGVGRVRSIDLTDNGRSSGAARVGFNLTWIVRNEVTDLFATFNPYYNEVFADNDFSTYGASGGLGWSRRTAPTRTWNLAGTISFAPDQNIPEARISDGLQDPNIRLLVPRNGFLALDIDGGLSLDLSARSRLGLTGLLSSRRYDVYTVETADDEPVGDLVDQRHAGLGVDWSHKSSVRNRWGVGSSARVIGLGDDPGNSGQGEETRLQVSVSGSFSRQLSPRSSLSVRSGYSAIDTGDGSSQSAPTLNVGWGWTGEHLSSQLNLNRNQGIFPASTTAVDTTDLAGSMAWAGRRQSLSVLAGYSVSRRAGEDRSSEDTRTRNLSVSYNRQARGWGWFLTLFSYRQSTDTDFAGALVSSGGAVGLSWQLTGARS